VPAFLEDYAFLAGGLLDLYEATLEQKWLNEARTLAADILQLFRDPESDEFTLVGKDAEQMPARVSSDHDGVTPSARVRTARLLYRLAWIDATPELTGAARTALNGIIGEIQHNPLGHLGALQVLEQLESEPSIATFTGATDTPEAFALNVALHSHAVRNLMIRSEHRLGSPALSLCLPGTCYPAVTTAEELRQLFSTQ
jgi:uncharacterized protein YyaL (SSP411 family)